MGLVSQLLDLIFPPRCVFCSSFLKNGETEICKKCASSLPRTGEASIMVSGHFFDTCVSPLYYTGTVRKSLLKYKFGSSPENADCYGKLLADCIRRELRGRYDLISWVPLSEMRQKKRGYDQAMLLALATALELSDVAVETLHKDRETDVQSRIEDPILRRENIRGAYSVTDEAIIAGKRILLIDDIITTGATLSECARTLRKAGARSVVCACLARSPKL